MSIDLLSEWYADGVLLSLSLSLYKKCVSFPFLPMYKLNAEHKPWHILQGDHVTFLNVYKGFIQSNKSSKWCHKNFINYNAMVNLSILLIYTCLDYIHVWLVFICFSWIEVVNCFWAFSVIVFCFNMFGNPFAEKGFGS